MLFQLPFKCLIFGLVVVVLSWKRLNCSHLVLDFVNAVIQKFFLLLATVLIFGAYTFFENCIAENERMGLLYSAADEITAGAINNSKNVDALPTWQLLFVL